jgi:site-specific recombinase XerD
VIVRAKILAYSASTWKSHSSTFTAFVKSCAIDLASCTPPTVSLYLLDLAGKGKSIGVIERTVSTITFVFKWLHLDDLAKNVHVQDIVKFLRKTCPKRCNKKKELGVKEIRKVWDSLESQYKDISNVPLPLLRSFVFLVTQHATFCRYSDLAGVKLSDILYDIDFFSINIRTSKTDQAGTGQTVYIPRNDNALHCPQMLMCLFLHKVHPDPDFFLFPALE